MIGWRYEWGAAKQGCVDCSGAFVYAMAKYGLKIYHGSNTIWRQYLTAKGKIGEIELVPGMAVFRWKNDRSEPDKFKPDGEGNFHHVGVYAGDGMVIEAKGTQYGVVQSPVAGWTHAGRVKGIDYSDTRGEEPMGKQAKVTTASGALNMREDKNEKAVRLMQIPKGATVDVLDTGDGVWWKIAYGGKTGYAMARYMTMVSGEADSPSPDGAKSLVIPCGSAAEAEKVLALLKSAKVQ